MCEPYKSLKTILGLAKPTSNHFLQFSLNFFNLLQFASCSFFLSPTFSFFLTVFLLSSFCFESCFSFEGIFIMYQPCRSNTRIKAKIPEPPGRYERKSQNYALYVYIRMCIYRIRCHPILHSVENLLNSGSRV